MLKAKPVPTNDKRTLLMIGLDTIEREFQLPAVLLVTRVIGRQPVTSEAFVYNKIHKSSDRGFALGSNGF